MPSLPQHTSHEHLDLDNLPELTAAQADYLEIIYAEQLKTAVARGCSIAQTAGVSRATVAATMRSLKALGLINYYPYGPLEMTADGLILGKLLHEKRKALEVFFSEVIGLATDAARKAAKAHAAEASEESIAVAAALVDFVKKHENEWHQARQKALLALQPKEKA